MKISYTLISELGSFTSEETEVTQDQYDFLLEITKTHWSKVHLNKTGYEMQLPGGFLIASPGTLEKSILIINKLDS